MTMEKQRDNPKFKFLFGGESLAYYRWRVNQEQQASSRYGQQPPPPHQQHQQIPSLMSQQPQAPPYGAPPTSQAPPPPHHAPNYQQQQQQQGSYPQEGTGFSQPPQGSWGRPNSGPGGQKPQPLLPRKIYIAMLLCVPLNVHKTRHINIVCSQMTYIHVSLVQHLGGVSPRPLPRGYRSSRPNLWSIS